jgi:hypothetical protein
MRKRIWAAIGALALAALPGCSCMHGVDQWKCDNLGWCCFGTTPSARQSYSPVCPAPLQEPCEPGASTPPVYIPR